MKMFCGIFIIWIFELEGMPFLSKFLSLFAAKQI